MNHHNKRFRISYCCPNNVQVLWVGEEAVSATWVHEKSLSMDVIDEYEKGVSMVVKIQESSLGGQTSLTAVDVNDDRPQRKMSRTERWIAPSSLG